MTSDQQHEKRSVTYVSKRIQCVDGLSQMIMHRVGFTSLFIAQPNTQKPSGGIL